MNVTAAVLRPAAEEVAVRSSLLGTLVLPAKQVFEFKQGILGFPQARSFALVPARHAGLFWLQSLDFEALTFLLADPFPLVDGYSVELRGTELGFGCEGDPSQVLILAILTLPRAPDQDATANLQGPLVFHLQRRLGWQLILQDSPYSVRHPVKLSGGGRS